MNITIGALDVVVATLFTNYIVPPGMAFRIFQDMRGVQAVYRMTDSTTTVLTQDLTADDDGALAAQSAICCGDGV